MTDSFFTKWERVIKGASIDDTIYVVSDHADLVKKQSRKKFERYNATRTWRNHFPDEASFNTEAEAHAYIRQRATAAAEKIAHQLALANKRCARVAKKFPLAPNGGVE